MMSLIYNVIMLVAQVASGTQGPPPPAPNDTRGPHLPIDEHIWILLAIGLIFGSYIVFNRYKAINKAS